MTEILAALPVGLPIPRPSLGPEEERLAARCVNRLLKNQRKPYFLALAVAGLISLRTTNASSADTRIGVLARGFDRIFSVLGLQSFNDWRPEVHLAVALSGQIPQFSPPSARDLVYTYLGVQRDEAEWLAGLSSELQATARPLLLPPLDDPVRLWRHAPDSSALHPRRAALNRRTDWLMARYADLAALAKTRWNFLSALETAASSGETVIDIEALGGRHRFGIWKVICPGRVARLCDYLGSDPGTTRPWFLDLVDAKLLVQPPVAHDASTWLTDRGLPVSYFASLDPGVLRPQAPEAQMVQQLARRTEHPCFAIAPLALAARFGRLALLTMLDNGPRLSELRQLSTDPSRLYHPPGTDAALFTAVVKGGLLGEFPLSPRTLAAAAEVERALQRHYRLPPEAPLPEVPFRGAKPTRPAGRYLFQFRHHHLDGLTVMACLRFLLYGLFREGESELNLGCHLFRHGCAKARQEGGVSLSMISGLLHHADIQTTYHYSRPTISQSLRAALRSIKDQP